MAATKILLYSGGMDSWLISKLWKPDKLVYVDMHTRYSKQEIENIHKTRDDVQIIDFPLGQWEREDKIIPLRNLYLPMVICNSFPEGDLDICIGATKGDRVLDKSKPYIEKINDILNYLYSPQWWIPDGRHIRINIDFKDYTKEDMLKMYLDQGGTLDEAFYGSFSCYEPDENGNACYRCKPCFRKFVAFAEMGYKFQDSVLEKVIPYIGEKIVPQIESHTYGRGEKEERAIMEIYNKYKEYDK